MVSLPHLALSNPFTSVNRDKDLGKQPTLVPSRTFEEIYTNQKTPNPDSSLERDDSQATMAKSQRR